MQALKWLNQNVANLQPYEPGRPIEEVSRELGLDPAQIAKLASNENPLGTSPKALAAMRAALPESFRYPDGGAWRLRQKLAGVYGVDMAQVVVGAGSNELIEFIAHCFLGPGRSVVVSAYAFVIYKLMAKMFGSAIIEVPARDYGHDLDAMLAAIRPDTSVVFLCNPNNPTGTMFGPRQLADFMAKVPEDKLVVFDEAYAEIALGEMPDSLGFVKAGRACVMLRTFSKAYGLAGLRLGYGIAPKAVAEALQRPRQPFNANLLAQEAGIAALDDHEFLRATRETLAKGRDYLEAQCRAMGLEFVRTYANFMLIRVGAKAGEINRLLTAAGVIVRPMGPYQLPEFLRVSFGTMAENEKFIAALKSALAKARS